MTLTRVPFTRKPKATTTAYAAALKVILPALLERCDYRCELMHPTECIEGRLHPHHRKLRSQGGKSTMGSVRMLCPGCHLHVHLNPSESYSRGWLVKSSGDPETIAFETWRDDG